ncbi:class I SAM-dependent methyltransferase [Thioalkalivibrio sp. XN8]|uniref:ubiquinone/menaquinone biosynthesis methyltransferase n=1 Tax=Thioalkalivibrio sp. XN8 TaxID=2712863 RepID=UPI0013ECB7CC|nr:class I SAM-dependent methyltransferase [Thioalkalivibrio sp. XN8]
MSDLSRTFGSQEVDPREREQLVRDVFRRVARRYDLMNDLMSCGIHRLWKRSMAWAVNPGPGQCIVDLAGGTGDIAHRLAGVDRQVIVVDPSYEMMAAGRDSRHHALRWVAGTAEQMPLPDASVDAVTIAFGIRNVTRIEDALAEILRVLKPGGRLLCLEFSRVQGPLRVPYEFYNRWAIPAIGTMVAGDTSAYRYLVESIRRFPDQQAFCGILREAGFTDVWYRNYSMGIAALHVGSRPA